MHTRERGKSFGNESGSQLLELALVLPLVLVMAAGVMDFASAWNTRQILANAAREGARLGSFQPLLDLNTTNPPTIQAICQDVANYLSQANINTAFMNGTSTNPAAGCSSPATVANTSSSSSGAAPAAWTYYSSGTFGLKIERTLLVSVTSGSTTTNVPSTRVTLQFPYSWTFGFNHLLNLLNPSAGSAYAATVPITVYATMADN